MAIFKPPIGSESTDFATSGGTTSNTFKIGITDGITLENGNGDCVRVLTNSNELAIINAAQFVAPSTDGLIICKLNSDGVKWLSETVGTEIVLGITGGVKFRDSSDYSLKRIDVGEIYSNEVYVPKYHGSLASAPLMSVVEGDEYRNTGDSKFYKYDGSSWIALN